MVVALVVGGGCVVFVLLFLLVLVLVLVLVSVVDVWCWWRLLVGRLVAVVTSRLAVVLGGWWS